MNNVQDDAAARKQATLDLRRFLGIADDEPIETTIFQRGKIFVAQPTDADAHVKLVARADRMPDASTYFLFNTINPAILARYRADTIERAWNHRASDGDIVLRRAVFVDVDAVRPKGISSTADELEAAQDVFAHLQEWLAEQVGANAIATGCSGNGFYLLIAIEPTPPTPNSTQGISRLLRGLNDKFGNARAKIDQAVANPARLMPAPGTWKRKGENWPDRPYRMVTFGCPEAVERVPLGELVG